MFDMKDLEKKWNHAVDMPQEKTDAAHQEVTDDIRNDIANRIMILCILSGIFVGLIVLTITVTSSWITFITILGLTVIHAMTTHSILNRISNLVRSYGLISAVHMNITMTRHFLALDKEDEVSPTDTARSESQPN